MANNDAEDDNFFGTEFPLLEPDEHARPPNVAGPPANVARPPTNAGQPPPRAFPPSGTPVQPTANAGQLPPRANFQRPTNIGQRLPRVVFQHTANASRIPVRANSRPPAQARPPENVGRARRNLLDRVLPPPGLEATEEEIAERRLRQQFDPLDSRLAQQAALDRTRTRPNLGDTLSQPLSQRTSILEERSLSLASASPYTEHPESGHTRPRSTPFPTWSSQLPIRPRPPLPPRRNLRLDLQTPAPPVGPRNQVRQASLPYRNPSRSAIAQSIVATPPVVTRNFVVQNPGANTQARSTQGLDQSPAYTSGNIPNADSADQGSPPETASSASALDEGAPDEGGPGPSENPPFDNSSLEPQESSEADPERTSRTSSDDDNYPDQGSTHEGASGPGAPDQGGLDKGGESPPRDGSSKKTPSASPCSDVPYLNQSSNMPYNNAAIPPPEEISGQASLPLARVKKILQIDEDTVKVSNNAAFVITIATEMFIRHLAEQAMNVAKLDKKPRRNIQYKDLANAVARIDNLQFLEDVIPRTTTYREYKAKKASKAPTHLSQPLQNGQTTLDGARSLPQRPVPMADAARTTMDDGNMSDGTIDEPSVAQTQPVRVNGSAGLVFEHYEPNGTTRRDESGDIDMG